MVKYRQMKLLAMVMLLVLAAAACSAARLSVDALPESVRPHAEVETNVSFHAGATSDNLWRLSIALETTVINARAR